VISRRWNTVMYRGSCYATAAVIAVATAATATAVATAAAASREAVPSQVSCVRAIFAFLSKTNSLQSGCFNFPFQQSLKMEFKPLGFHQVGALSELVLRDRGPSRPICIKKLPSNDQCLHNVVCIFTTGSEFEKINQILIYVHCTTVA